MRLLPLLAVAGLLVVAPPAAGAIFAPVGDLGPGGLLTAADAHDGSQVVVRHDGSAGETRVDVRRPGRPWDPGEVAVGPDDAVTPNASAEAAIDAAGNVVIAWRDAEHVWTVERRNGIWGDPTPVFDVAGGARPDLDLAVNAAGDAAIAYTDVQPNTLTCPAADASCGTDFEVVELSSRAAGGVWRAPVVVSERSARRHQAAAPSAGIDDTGRATVAWLAHDSHVTDTTQTPWASLAHTVVRVRSLSGAGALGETQSLSPDVYDERVRFEPELAVTPGGQRDVAFVAERRCTGSCEYAYSELIAARGGTTGAMIGSVLRQGGVRSPLGTSVAVDSNARGDTAVVGTQRDDGPLEPVAAVRGALSDRWNVSASGPTVHGRPSAAVGPDGSTMIAYASEARDGSSRSVTAAFFDGLSWVGQELAGPADTWEPEAPGAYAGPEALAGAVGFGVVWPDPRGHVRERSTRDNPSASVSGSRLTYHASGGVANSITVTRTSNGKYRISDPRASGLAAGPGCARLTETTIDCPAAGVAEIRILGYDSDDRLSSTLPGGDVPVRLEGGDGDDLLIGGLGSETFNGGAGSDRVSYWARTSSQPVRVSLDGLANDGASGEGDRDVSIEHVSGGAGADRLTGSSVRNDLSGGAGNDVLDGRLGADTLNGGSGVDTISYATRTEPVAVRLDGARNDGADWLGNGTSGSWEEYDQDLSIEIAVGGSADDMLYAMRADATVQTLVGGAGNDFLHAREGTTTIDRLLCGTGTDTGRFDPSDYRSSCETAG